MLPVVIFDLIGHNREPIGFMPKQTGIDWSFCHFGQKMSDDQLLFLALPVINGPKSRHAFYSS
jgi:hypothetical protein